MYARGGFLLVMGLRMQSLASVVKYLHMQVWTMTSTIV